MREKIASFKFALRKNKLIRALLIPYFFLRNRLLIFWYKLSKDSEKIKKYAGKYEGRRCFIVGNGPSLSASDLDLIKKEYSFASNRIYKIFDDTSWRPNFYFCSDNDILAEELGNINKLEIKNIFVRRGIFRKKCHKAINQFILIAPPYIDKAKFQKKEISADCSKYVSLSPSVSLIMIEFAIYMGFKEIYLIGMDHSYPVSITKQGIVVDNSIQSHFDKDDTSKLPKKRNHKNIYFLDASTQAFDLYKRYADENGIKIMNATRGGKLEVYPRIELERILEKK